MPALLNLALGLLLLSLAARAVWAMLTYREPARTCWRCGRTDKVGGCGRADCP